MNAQYYVGRDGRQFGPYSENEILKALQKGTFKETDLAWRDGMKDYAPLRDVIAVRPPDETEKKSPAPKQAANYAFLRTSRGAAPLKPGVREAVQPDEGQFRAPRYAPYRALLIFCTWAALLGGVLSAVSEARKALRSKDDDFRALHFTLCLYSLAAMAATGITYGLSKAIFDIADNTRK